MSSDSSSADPSSPDAVAPATKRTRTGKPKVKTGCLTCKIRRVKCDEGRPACQRCISTGRTCDGYDANVSPRSRKNKNAMVAATQLRPQINTQSSLALSFPRQLQADITGTEMERFYFHCFRSIAGEAVGIRHKHNNLFWKEVVPQYCYEVDSMKHAFIAFGAAYHNYQVKGLRPDPRSPPNETERFIIRQYTLAMKGLSEQSRHVPVRRKYGITLISCVAFFCIEMLRNDWDAALTHLSNGLQLMASLPDEVADILNNPEKWSQGEDTSYARVSYMLRLLSRWEVSMRLITGDFRPRLTLRMYESRKLDSETGCDFSSLEEMFEAVDSFCQDVSAFAWLTRDHRGDEKFWSHARPELQHGVLQERSKLIRNHIHLLHKNCDPVEVAPQDIVFFHVSQLRFKGASLVLRLLPQPAVSGDSLEDDEVFQFEDFLSTAHTTRELVVAHPSAGQSGSKSNVDLGVVPALYVTGSTCRDPTLRKKILQLVMNWPQRENLWDGPALRQMLDANGLPQPAKGVAEPVSFTAAPERWSGALPGMWF